MDAIDRTIEVPLYTSFVSNNTYGIKAYSPNEVKLYQDKALSKGGCKELATPCETASLQLDPEGLAREPTINKLCERAALACGEIKSAYSGTGRGIYDIAARSADPKPPLYFLDYINQAETQEAIGSPINLTYASDTIFHNFYLTGDRARGGNTDRLARLVNKGVRVALIFGDRDYVCNWFGGEAVALAIAQKAGGDYATRFPSAGYAPIITNESYIGGDVRQYGNLSFSRIFQAGHSAAAYQPETVFQVFARIVMGKSLSTGQDVDLTTFNTTGPSNSTYTANPPNPPDPTCFVRAFNNTCNGDARRLVESGGGGVVINGVLYSKSEDWPLATPSAHTVETMPATQAMTGIFTATKTPSNTAASLQVSPTLPMLGLSCAILILADTLASYR